jgi:uncharacterized protein YegP (UPF0339 family)/outer membrane protein OmpA-like peptidoglycan-associated protein
MAQNETRTEDNYLHCDRYAGHESAGVENHPQFTKFQDPETDLYYFSYLEDDGSVIFRSEGYPTTAARDNGVDSVTRNMELEERYKVVQFPDGMWYVSLRAGNHQEIARSCGFSSEEGASYLTPSGRERRRAEREAAAAMAAAASAASVITIIDEAGENTRVEDNYLACKEYAGHERDADNSDFAKFKHANGEHYFVMYDEDGDVLLRSEGYPTTAARDNGMQSVIKNRDNEDRYAEKTTVNGYSYVSLKAGNHQEIARSCPKKPSAVSATEATAGVAAVAAAAAAIEIPSIEIEAPVVEVEVPVIEVEAPVIETPVVEVEAPKVEIAAAAVAAAATVAAAVEMPSVEVEAPKVEAVVEAPVVEEKVIHEAPVRSAEKEDDYLPCEAYKGKTVNDKRNNVALFKHDDGQYYFVLYNADGSVKLRSEGFKNAKTRDEELSGVLKHHNDESMYHNLEKGGYIIRVLKDKTGREVGRSCVEKVGGVSAAAPIAIAGAATAAAAVAANVELPKAAAPVVPPVDVAAPVIEDAGGFKMWWLLPLLLLPLLWFMCNKCKPEAKVAATTEVKKEEPKPAAPVTKLSVKSLLPVVLYFDNDQPDANTTAKTTAKTYEQAYTAYTSLRPEFVTKGDGAATGTFFDNDVKKGMSDLAKLAAGLKDIVASGEKANIKIKGFASPLAKGDYNKSLTGRRVSSVENYLKSYDASLAKAITSGALKISFEENGKDKAVGGTDNVKDKKGSVYGVDASKERRVEITGVE